MYLDSHSLSESRLHRDKSSPETNHKSMLEKTTLRGEFLIRIACQNLRQRFFSNAQNMDAELFKENISEKFQF